MVWKLRNVDATPPIYGDGSDLFSIKIHHSGKLVLKENVEYINGKVDYIDKCCKDEMSKLELSYMARELGLVGCNEFYYSSSGDDKCGSLVEVRSDYDALAMCDYVNNYKTVVVFFVDEKVERNSLVVDESVTCMSLCEESSSENSSENTCESDGEYSIGDDSNKSDFYDSEGDYFDEDFKVDHEHDIENNMLLLKTKGKKPWEIGANVKFATYSGKGAHEYGGCKVFNPDIDMVEVKLEREMCFTSHKIFRAAVRKHAVDNGRTIHFPTNNTKRIQVKCVDDNCPFYVFAAKSPNDNTFQIKVIHFEHECIRQPKTVQADTRFLVNKYADKLLMNPNWDTKAMLVEVNGDCKVKFSKAQMYRTKHKVVKQNQGEGGDQFGWLRQYGAEILRSNPGSTFKIKVRTVGDLCYFKRVFICWAGLKDGMLDGCRKVILLDGCHIKTAYGGILLTAIGIDANNAMYPFAYAMVEKETKKSWLWFLKLVKTDLEITNCEAWTFMSDKQKGLLMAVESLFPGCEHRFCVMHLYSNFKLKHKGLTLKDMLWNAARATRVVDFERCMEDLKTTDVKAYEWLAKRPPQNWSKAFFKTLCKSDILLNNLSESFNGSISKIRRLPILWMLESIRFKLMETIGEKREKMIRYRGIYCPRIAAIFEKNMIMSMEFTPHWNGHGEFNVQRSEFGSSYRVFLPEKFCSCRRWQLTGIPCAHAICGMVRLGYKAEEFIDDCYTKETYLRIYSHYLIPISSQEEWPSLPEGATHILPPIVETKPGRPKEYKRKFQKGEVKGKIIQTDHDKKFGKMSKKGGVITCGACGGKGHNKRSCGSKTDDVYMGASNSNRVGKLQVRRNAGSWLNCSSISGVTYSQPTQISTSGTNEGGVDCSQPTFD